MHCPKRVILGWDVKSAKRYRRNFVRPRSAARRRQNSEKPPFDSPAGRARHCIGQAANMRLLSNENKETSVAHEPGITASRRKSPRKARLGWLEDCAGPPRVGGHTSSSRLHPARNNTGQAAGFSHGADLSGTEKHVGLRRQRDTRKTSPMHSNYAPNVVHEAFRIQ
jgi:hypothetical protein